MSTPIICKMIEAYDKHDNYATIEGRELGFKWLLSMAAYFQLRAELKSLETDKLKIDCNYFRGIAIYILPSIDDIVIQLMYLPLAQISSKSVLKNYENG